MRIFVIGTNTCRGSVGICGVIFASADSFALLSKGEILKNDTFGYWSYQGCWDWEEIFYITSNYLFDHGDI